MFYWLGLFVISFLVLQDCTQSVLLLEVRIPKSVVKGSPALLECLYDLDGDALYSVKWYKESNEFYRYVPRDMPPAQTFMLPGVEVDLLNSSDATMTLRNVTWETAGRFRCEVSGEAPSFQTIDKSGEMKVVLLPEGPPIISGLPARSHTGDWVRANCTCGRSKPAVQLSWFINGEAAEPHTIRRYETIVSGREGLETSVQGLQFRVEQQHIRAGSIKLKCAAEIGDFYYRSNEESIEVDRPQKAPVLESRETVYASNSRADPVQASNGTDSLVVAHAPSWLLLLLVAAAVVAIQAASAFNIAGGLEQFQRSYCWQQQQQNDTEVNQLSQIYEKRKAKECKNVILSEKQEMLPLSENCSTAAVTEFVVLAAAAVLPQVATLKSLAAR